MTTLTQARFLKALKDEGVHVRKVSRAGKKWPNHTSAGTFNPHGVLNHHTASARSNSDSSVTTLLWNGRSDLVGPLAHIGLGHDGLAYLVGWGNCNHAGEGDAKVLNEVIDERPLSRPVVNNVDGNPNFWGIEVMNNGVGEPYPDAQIEALIKINAALCRASGWSEKSCIHHKEFTNRKTDMSWKGDLRGLIKDCLAEPAGKWKLNAPKKSAGPNVVVAEKAANKGLASAVSHKQPVKIKRWKKIKGLLRLFH